MRTILELVALLALLIALGVSYREEPQFASVEAGDICVQLITSLNGEDCGTDMECECLHGAGMEAED